MNVVVCLFLIYQDRNRHKLNSKESFLCLILGQKYHLYMLLTKLKVKGNKVAEYLEIADKTDKAVEAEEPRIIHHTFDQDPYDPLRFVCSEVYQMMMLYSRI